MTILKALLSLFSVFGKLSFLAKWIPSIAGFSGLFGPVGPFIAAGLTFIGQLFKWFFEGLTAMLSNPVTFVTAGILMALAFLGGVRLNSEAYEASLARKQATITKMIKDGEKADAEHEAKLKLAVAAAIKAANEELAKPEAPADKPVSVVKRVRPASTGKGLNQIGGPSVQWFKGVFGPSVTGPTP